MKLKKKISLTTEHQIQKQIVKFLRLHKILVFDMDCMGGLQFINHNDYKRFSFIKHHKAMGYEKGQPDMLMILPERIVFLEVKKIGTYQSKEQKEIQSQIKNLGREYYVIRDIEDVKKIIKGEV